MTRAWFAVVFALGLGSQAGAVLCHFTTSAPVLNSQLSDERSPSALILGKLLTENNQGQVTPGLAESWSESPDGKTFTVHLRRGVVFHETPFFKPTRSFQADDVAFSFDRQRLSTHPYFHVNSGKYPGFEGSAFSGQLLEMQKVGPYTVRFLFKERVPELVHEFTKPFAVILCAEYAESLLAKGQPELFDARPIGTGPYQVERLIGNRLELKANPSYWAGRSEPSELTLEFIPPTTGPVIEAAAPGPSGTTPAKSATPAPAAPDVAPAVEAPECRAIFGAVRI